jgi:hypothetical protein
MRWDRKAIDAALDALSGLHIKNEQTDFTALDEWRTNRALRSEGNS